MKLVSKLNRIRLVTILMMVAFLAMSTKLHADRASCIADCNRSYGLDVAAASVLYAAAVADAAIFCAGQCVAAFLAYLQCVAGCTAFLIVTATGIYTLAVTAATVKWGLCLATCPPE